MSQSIHEASVPVLLRALSNLTAVLDKGLAHAESEKIDPAVLLSSRLYPDMFALSRQVQIVSDQAKGGVARLAGVEPPRYADTEASFGELKERIARTAAYVRGFEPRQFDGADGRAVVLKFPSRTMSFRNGWEYLTSFVLPNVYFHSTTAYAILRHCGVRLGKGDFIGPIGEG